MAFLWSHLQWLPIFFRVKFQLLPWTVTAYMTWFPGLFITALASPPIHPLTHSTATSWAPLPFLQHFRHVLISGSVPRLLLQSENLQLPSQDTFLFIFSKSCMSFLTEAFTDQPHLKWGHSSYSSQSPLHLRVPSNTLLLKVCFQGGQGSIDQWAP